MNRIWKVAVLSTMVWAGCEAGFCQSPAATPDAMKVTARVNEDSVKVRKGPGGDFGQTRLVARGAKVVITGREGSWLHVTLSNGDTGWIWSKFADPEQAPAVPKPAKLVAESREVVIAPTKSAAKAGPAPAPAKGVVVPAARVAAAPKQASEVGRDVVDALSGTKPDILGGANETPAASGADSFRVLIVLLPILGGVVLAVKGLAAAKDRTGRVPDLRKGLRNAILGGFNLNNARKNGGSSIRVIESIPLGSASLHLVEVRGKMLLLGAAGNTLTNLADVSDTTSADATGDDSFRAILNNMSDDLVEDYSDLRGDLGAVVGSLDNRIRETTEAIARTAVRSRR